VIPPNEMRRRDDRGRGETFPPTSGSSNPKVRSNE
jgi:hypothetical protein